MLPSEGLAGVEPIQAYLILRRQGFEFDANSQLLMSG